MGHITTLLHNENGELQMGELIAWSPISVPFSVPACSARLAVPEIEPVATPLMLTKGFIKVEMMWCFLFPCLRSMWVYINNQLLQYSVSSVELLVDNLLLSGGYSRSVYNQSFLLNWSCAPCPNDAFLISKHFFNMVVNTDDNRQRYQTLVDKYWKFSFDWWRLFY